jgi:serine/threonine protein kinase
MKKTYREGRNYEKEKDYHNAIKCYEKALKKCSDYPEYEEKILLRLATLYHKTNQNDSAKEYLNKLFMRYPYHQKGNFLMGKILLNEGDVKKALYYFKRAKQYSSPLILDKINRDLEKLKGNIVKWSNTLQVYFNRNILTSKWTSNSITLVNNSDYYVEVKKIYFKNRNIKVRHLNYITTISPKSKVRLNYEAKVNEETMGELLTDIDVSYCIEGFEALTYSKSYNDVLFNIAERLFGDNYQIMGKPIGSGSFAEVYRARNIETNKLVALKVFRSLNDINIFEREIKNWKRLESPYIVQLYGYGKSPNPYIEMELCETCLKKELDFNKVIDLKTGLKYMIQILEGLRDAHNKGIIHRDLKPDNILLESGVIKITDWGLSKARDSSTKSASGFKGTPQYAPYEQYLGKQASTKSDIWSFGVISYEMLTGENPFSGRSFEEIAKKIVDMDIRPPIEINKDIPNEVSEIILKCINKKPNNRPSAKGIINDLKDILKSGYLNGTKTMYELETRQSSRIIYLTELAELHLLLNNIEELHSNIIRMKKYVEKDSVMLNEIDKVCKALEYRIKNNVNSIPRELALEISKIIKNFKVGNYNY